MFTGKRAEGQECRMLTQVILGLSQLHHSLVLWPWVLASLRFHFPTCNMRILTVSLFPFLLSLSLPARLLSNRHQKQFSLFFSPLFPKRGLPATKSCWIFLDKPFGVMLFYFSSCHCCIGLNEFMSKLVHQSYLIVFPILETQKIMELDYF